MRHGVFGLLSSEVDKSTTEADEGEQKKCFEHNNLINLSRALGILGEQEARILESSGSASRFCRN